MEGIGAFLDQEWESLSKLFSIEEDSDFLNSNVFGEIPPSDFLSGGGDDQNHDDVAAGFDGSLFLPSHHHHHHHHSVLDDANFYYVSQESSQSGSNDINYNGVNTFESPMDFGAMNMMRNSSTKNDVMEEILQLKADIMNEELGNNADSSCKRKHETVLPQDNCPKKKPRISRNAQKKTKNVPQSKKNKKAAMCIDDDQEQAGNINVNGGEINGQSSSTCSSEGDDSNASQEVMDITGGAISESKKSASNGKAKAGKGTATDPQSLYARKRREKINERLRILQNLVPNGTKVDISTMLEEAVHYVKFLQLQIKLLSSDEMWMYAPIAYNGMDMGLYQKINNLPNLC